MQDGHQHLVAGDGGFQIVSGLERRRILAIRQSSLVDPAPDAVQLPGAQRILTQRHLPRLYLLKQQAPLSRPRNDGRPRGSAPEQTLARTQVQLFFLVLGAVASQAFGLQDGENPGLEARRRIGFGGRGDGPGCDCQAASQQ